MTFFARFLSFLFWVLVIFWGLGLAKRFVGWMLRHPRQEAPDTDSESRQVPSSRRLVRDPVCGTHVAEALALPVRQGNEIVHFCSAECRARYLSEVHRKVANG